MAAEMAAEMATTLLPTNIYCYICHFEVNKHCEYMYTNVVQHCNCQSQNNFLTLNITLRKCIKRHFYSDVDVHLKGDTMLRHHKAQ